MVTPIQRRIELSVTNGLGYDTQTDFSNNYSFYSDFLNAEDVKNTPEGLKAHLRRLTCPELAKYGKPVEQIASPMGNGINVSYLSAWRCNSMEHKNQSLVNKAYNAEAKRQGRINTLVEGILRKIIGHDPIALVESMNTLPSS